MNKVTDMIKTEENEISPLELIEEFIHYKQNKDLADEDKLNILYTLFTSVLETSTKEENIQFPTLFSRLAYVGLKYNLSGTFLFYAHCFRKCLPDDVPSEIKISLGNHVVSHLFSHLWKNCYPTPPDPLHSSVKTVYFKKKTEVSSFQPYTEGLLVDIQMNDHTFTFIDEKEGDIHRLAHWNVSDRNELFNNNILSVHSHFELPVAINLIESEVSKEGEYYPRAVVIHPDFLVDVTSVAECFKENGSFPMIYMLNKFRDERPKTPVLVGNIVNFLFEEIFYKNDGTLTELKEKIFQKFALGLSLLSDLEMKDVWDQLGRHFVNLKKVIKVDLPAAGIHKESAYLETSFFSRKYGIQGRLDLFVHDEQHQTFAIVELKSGSPWKPNVYGISASHFAQTQIYELLIKSVYDKTNYPVKNYILYSKTEQQPLRFAPAIKPHHWEILRVRNDIVILEHLLSKANENPELLASINRNDMSFATGFMTEHVDKFEKTYQSLSPLEKNYFLHSLSFIAREYSVAKIGEHGQDNARGHAALWLESDEEKSGRFALIKGLKIHCNESERSDPRLIFTFDPADNVANFRKGDIVLIYPVTRQHRPVLHAQLLKCTITEIQSGQIEVRLRNKQKNQNLFRHDVTWNMEEDLIDSSFQKLYESVYSFARERKEYKSIFLGIQPPSYGKEIKYVADKNLTSEQNKIVEQALSAGDFFLIWGPPGTGKTNVVLKKLTETLFSQPEENIMLIAYTNRAVDEICQSVYEIPQLDKSDFVRIGSKIAANQEFHENLLDHHLEKFNTRKQILEFIQSKRIFIGTVSSVLGKPEIFQLKKFTTVIVDEASQILEPMLCGLLARFSKRILIGDHKQLPAVVRQNEKHTKTEETELAAAGIHNLSYSLFDRMYHQYKTNRWDYAIGTLSQQGRMHGDLQSFVNEHFYEHKLNPLEGMQRLRENRFLRIRHQNQKAFNQRNLFVHTKRNSISPSKVNYEESKVCVEIIKIIEQILHDNSREITPKTIGVVTPFRAQIARINEDLRKSVDAQLADKITVDTVERYQGGARDIIIFSLCVNSAVQLKKITSVNQEGLDRKLNVTLTRAKEQIIMIGDKNVLSKSLLYKKWIEYAFVMDSESVLNP